MKCLKLTVTQRDLSWTISNQVWMERLLHQSRSRIQLPSSPPNTLPYDDFPIGPINNGLNWPTSPACDPPIRRVIRTSSPTTERSASPAYDPLNCRAIRPPGVRSGFDPPIRRAIRQSGVWSGIHPLLYPTVCDPPFRRVIHPSNWAYTLPQRTVLDLCITCSTLESHFRPAATCTPYTPTQKSVSQEINS